MFRGAAMAPLSRPWMRIPMVVLEVLLGLAALAGGLALIAAPDGALLRFPPTLLAGAPFADFLVPGLLLVLLAGLALSAAAVTLMNGRRDWVLAGATGLGFVVWMAVQLALLGYVHWTQPVVLAWGAAIALLALGLAWREFATAPAGDAASA